jgi:hypothetical protein
MYYPEAGEEEILVKWFIRLLALIFMLVFCGEYYPSATAQYNYFTEDEAEEEEPKEKKKKKKRRPKKRKSSRKHSKKKKQDPWFDEEVEDDSFDSNEPDFGEETDVKITPIKRKKKKKRRPKRKRPNSRRKRKSLDEEFSLEDVKVEKIDRKALTKEKIIQKREARKQEKVVKKILKNYKLMMPLERKFRFAMGASQLMETYTGIQKNANVEINQAYTIPTFSIGGEYQFMRLGLANTYLFFDGELTRGDVWMNMNIAENSVKKVHVSLTTLDLALRFRWVFRMFGTYSSIDLKTGYMHHSKESNGREKFSNQEFFTNPTSINLVTDAFYDIFYTGLDPTFWLGNSFGISLNPQVEWIPFFSEDPQFASGRSPSTIGYSAKVSLLFKVGNFTFMDIYSSYRVMDTQFSQATTLPNTLRSDVTKGNLIHTYIGGGLRFVFML